MCLAQNNRWIDTLYEENGSRKISAPGGIHAWNIPTHKTPPLKTLLPPLPLQKIATDKILTWNIFTISLVIFLNSLNILLIILRQGSSVWE